ncbi:hypothetical protein H7K45_05675 [Mycobacterium yunnanensis]|uniref:ScyD/ScyE family protein n=1 Tax=Mycobacterium yunnanensis TaxID=368477 RepID=A0A9X3C156_9MYCO|nr:hypothetical protein [Mycobacterium yunnanensis]MCV7420021.1 hypothetical protein [Mycobacterium yunnanensis]
MRLALIVLTILFGVMAAPAAPANADATPQPDLSGFTTVSTYPYVMGNELYFQTPDGLLCAMLPDRNVVGCDGRLPGTAPEVNEIGLSPDASTRGLSTTANHRFVKSTGNAAPLLREGQKIVFGDFECAVGADSYTACTKGQPVAQWMVVSPKGTGIGPATAGLPPGFPDPNDFILGDDTYIVGQGAKNLFPVFHVEGGLTCSIVTFSGGEIGCDGPLPRVLGGENEVYAQLPGPSGIRRTDAPRFATPAYPGPVKQLPVGHRVHGIGAVCMAIPGGVACTGSVDGAVHAFEVTPSGVSTYGA